MDIRKTRKCTIRYLIRRDVAIICEMDDHYSEDEIIAILKRRDTVGYVIEISEQIVGYCVYRLQGDSIKILHIFTNVNHRRSGLALQVIQKLATRLQSTIFRAATHRQIIAMVSEVNLDALMFLKSIGFKGRLVKKRDGNDSIKMVLKNDA